MIPLTVSEISALGAITVAQYVYRSIEEGTPVKGSHLSSHLSVNDGFQHNVVNFQQKRHIMSIKVHPGDSLNCLSHFKKYFPGLITSNLSTSMQLISYIC